MWAQSTTLKPFLVTTRDPGGGRGVTFVDMILRVRALVLLFVLLFATLFSKHSFKFVF